MPAGQADEFGVTREEGDRHALGGVSLQTVDVADVAHERNGVERTGRQSLGSAGRERRGASHAGEDSDRAPPRW